MATNRLRTLILQHLAKAPHSGYSLIKEIEQASGWRPSYGSMYPQLEQLREEKLVVFEQKNKKKIYTLTASGKAELKQIAKSPEFLNQIKEDMRLLAHLLDLDDETNEQLMQVFTSALEKGNDPFKQIHKPMQEFKLAFWKLIEEDKLDKKKTQVKKILQEATKELGEL